MTDVSARRILIVDDEPHLRDMLAIAFKRDGFEVSLAPGVKAASQQLAEVPTPFPVILTDLVMPDGSGLDVVSAAKKRAPSSEVIVMTAHSTVDAAVSAMRAGAFDFIIKPFSPAHVLAQADKALAHSGLLQENVRLKAQLERHAPHDLDLGSSPRMQAVGDLISKVASARTTLLITGESGTGKERVARLIHERSGRTGAFRVVNCGALPEALMESELFGHEKGAFTGAATKTVGLFRDADGGTLLLDEVGELPLGLQVKLLRVLQEKKVRSVGGTVESPVDVRVIAATNRDVEGAVRAGSFRQDLYYRLNVIRLELPPLRDRRDDVPKMAERFVRRFSDEAGKEIRGLTADALRALDGYDFPGNVRELENMMERAVALAEGHNVSLGDLPVSVAGTPALPTPLVTTLPPEGCQLDDVLGEVERRLILQAIERSNGVRTAAAKLLGVTFRSLRYRLEKLGIAGEGEEDGDDRETSPSSPRR
jgi:two-component system response regulator PilR (NtrC family)